MPKYLAVYGAASRAPESQLIIPVEVIEAKTAFGRDLLVVAPVAGKGTATVSAKRVADSPAEAAQAKAID